MIDLFAFLITAYVVYRIYSRLRAQKKKQAARSAGNPKAVVAKDERYYANVLELRGPVTRDGIRKKYRELVPQYHPDKVAHLGAKLRVVAEEKTKEINEAYNFFKQRYALKDGLQA